MKNHVKLKLFVALVACLAVSCSRNTVYHVSPDGDDNAAGTARAPWKTPAVAVERAVSLSSGTGAKVIFHGGVYPLERPVVIDSASGLTLCAAKGEAPILDGSVPIRGWQKDNDIWKTRLDCDLGVAVSEKGRFDLYCDGDMQTLARWPNDSFEHVGAAVGKTPTPDNWAEFVGSYEGVLSFRDTPVAERLERWAEEADAWMLGYWFWDWYESYQKVRAIDIDNKIVELDGPHSPYGYRNGARFYVLNALCELDTEKEFYLDRRDGTLYWFPPEGVDPETADVRASVFSGDYMVTANGCDDLTVEGLTMRCGRNGAVRIAGGNGNTLKDCTIEMFGSDAVDIDGKNHLVSGCRLRELGCGGMTVTGGDRKTLEGSGHRITGTIVEHFSLFKHTYKPAVLFSGVGLHLDHCLLTGSSSSALRYGGNDILVEYNIFSDLVKESDDQGGLDCWYDIAERGNVIRYNYWKNITGGVRVGASAIRFDDIISGQTVYGNVIENCGGAIFGGVQIHGGRDNQVYGNVFIGCPYAVSCSPWSDESWESSYAGQKAIIDRYDIFGSLYTDRYPEIKDIMDGNHNRNFIHDNLAVDIPEFARNPEQNEMYNNTVINSDGRDLRYFIRPDVLKQYGIAPIPFDRMGPKKK